MKFVEEVLELWEDEFSHGQFDRAGGAGEGEEELALGDAGDGTAQQCAAADVLVAEHAEKLAESGEGLGEEGFDNFDGGVAA